MVFSNESILIDVQVVRATKDYESSITSVLQSIPSSQPSIAPAAGRGRLLALAVCQQSTSGPLDLRHASKQFGTPGQQVFSARDTEDKYLLQQQPESSPISSNTCLLGTLPDDQFNYSLTETSRSFNSTIATHGDIDSTNLSAEEKCISKNISNSNQNSVYNEGFSSTHSPVKEIISAIPGESLASVPTFASSSIDSALSVQDASFIQQSSISSAFKSNSCTNTSSMPSIGSNNSTLRVPPCIRFVFLFERTFLHCSNADSIQSYCYK